MEEDQLAERLERLWGPLLRLAEASVVCQVQPAACAVGFALWPLSGRNL